MIRTVIVDDSKIARDIIREFLIKDTAFSVVAEAENGDEAIRKVRELSPDLVTMDLVMRYSLEAIEYIHNTHGTPIVVISGKTNPKNMYETAMRGALDFFNKEDFSIEADEEKREHILKTLKRIARDKICQSSDTAAVGLAGKKVKNRTIKAIVVAGSTGGPRALQVLFSAIPKDFNCPIFVVQHNSTGFDKSFVEWLGKYSAIGAKMGENGERYEAGRIYIAPNGSHMMIDRKYIILTDSPPVHHQKPAADILFKSAAESYGEALLGIVLTGMGSDGTSGVLAIKEANGVTIAQDQDSSLIYGMPKSAVESGAIDLVLPLAEISKRIVELCLRGAARQ
ncbi:chemotaxis response regulator protein-glutamate methylesterase [Campylobacterota bacterium]|nr:chemotaxis response regulator protein-glutamate methylesterase [Campylobacterota bacterium]